MAVIDLGYKPRPWQHRVHLALSTHRWAIIVAARRSGKTHLALLHTIDRALKLTLPNGRYAYILPKLNQAKTVAWTWLKMYATRVPGTIVNESELHVTFTNGAQIRLYGSDNPDAMRGIYLDGAVIDELSDIKRTLWDDIVRACLSDRKGWCVFMGTVRGMNWTSETYFKALKDPAWTAHKLTIYETDALPPEEIESVRGMMPESAFKREYLCDFNAAVDDILLSFDEVETATRRSYMAGDFQHAAKVIGVDVARQGDDSTVVIRRQGLMVWEPKSYQIPNVMEVADKVAFEINEWKPDAVFVDGTGGYGAGVIDRLRQLGHRVIEVQFSASPSDPKFLNKRAEMWWDMAQAVKANLQIPNHKQLKEDLCTPTYGFNLANKQTLESKDAIKARGLPSPDCGDALAVTYASKVTPTHVSNIIDAEFTVTKRVWNPLGRVAGYGVIPGR